VRRGCLAPFEKSHKSMKIKQRSVIKFFIDEGMKPLDIGLRLQKHSGPCAFYRSTLYFWIGGARRGRPDLSEIPGPGRTTDEGLTKIIPRRYEQDPHWSSRKLEQSPRISLTMICHYLSDVLGLKCLRLCRVLHKLTVD
jgi:hypothetical protein